MAFKNLITEAKIQNTQGKERSQRLKTLKPQTLFCSSRSRRGMRWRESSKDNPVISPKKQQGSGSRRQVYTNSLEVLCWESGPVWCPAQEQKSVNICHFVRELGLSGLHKNKLLELPLMQQRKWREWVIRLLWNSPCYIELLSWRKSSASLLPFKLFPIQAKSQHDL